MVADEISALARQRGSQLRDAQSRRLSKQVQSIKASWAARGFAMAPGGMFLEIAQACADAAGLRGEEGWREIRQVLELANLTYTDGLADELKKLMEGWVPFGDLQAVVENPSSQPVNPSGGQELRHMVARAISTARARLHTEIDLFVLSLRNTTSNAPAPRAKQQKFGVLDAPNLYSSAVLNCRGKLGSAVIYFDIDDFKALNTRLSETRVDDLILPSVHRLVADYVAELGFGYAEGGDEFKIYLPNATLGIAKQLAEAIRQALQACPFTDEAEGVTLTASFGIAHIGSTEGASDLSLHANLVKNEAKKRGKNCVSIWAAEK